MLGLYSATSTNVAFEYKFDVQTVDKSFNREYNILWLNNRSTIQGRKNMTNENVCAINLLHSEAINKALQAMPAEDVLCDAAELFKVFGDSTRIRIIAALIVGELCVCDICKVVDMSKSAVSHQLRILRQSKLVKSRKSGKEVYYALDDEHVCKIFKMALEHLGE